MSRLLALGSESQVVDFCQCLTESEEGIGDPIRRRFDREGAFVLLDSGFPDDLLTKRRARAIVESVTSCS